MHGRVIKHGTYIPVSSEPFDMPLPLNLELLHSNTLLCVYMISADKTVDFTYNANTDIPILTRTDRRLKIEDIYYLIRSRVFPDNPAVAPYELMRLGLHEYNPYEIIEISSLAIGKLNLEYGFSESELEKKLNITPMDEDKKHNALNDAIHQAEEYCKLMSV